MARYYGIRQRETKMCKDEKVKLTRPVRAVFVHGKTGRDVGNVVILTGTTVILLGQVPEAPHAPRFVMLDGYLYRLREGEVIT